MCSLLNPMKKTFIKKLYKFISTIYVRLVLDHTLETLFTDTPLTLLECGSLPKEPAQNVPVTSTEGGDEFGSPSGVRSPHPRGVPNFWSLSSPRSTTIYQDHPLDLTMGSPD